MELSSEKMVENLAYEIIYVNKGTEELKKEVNVNLFAKYVLAVRYECSEMYEKAYKLYEELAEKGFIKGMQRPKCHAVQRLPVAHLIFV